MKKLLLAVFILLMGAGFSLNTYAQEKPKAEKPEKMEKAEKPEKVEKAEKPEKMEKAEKSEKMEKAEKEEVMEKSEKAEKEEMTEKDEKMEKDEKAEELADAKPFNSVCPVSGEEIDGEHTYVYKGVKYATCCNKCMKKFKADPEKYISRLSEDGKSLKKKK